MPPADLHGRTLPWTEIAEGALGYRCHRVGVGALYFGPASATPDSRFHDPLGVFKVCYIAARPMGALVETFLRELPVRAVAEVDLRSRAITGIRLQRSLRVVQAHGKGLARLGTTAAIGAAKNLTATNPYEHSQKWARALHDHPDQPDGIEYMSSHDDTLRCLALFDRASAAAVAEPTTGTVWDDAVLVGRFVSRYSLALL